MAVGDKLATPAPERGRRLARFGSIFPFAGMAVVSIVAAIHNSATGHGIPSSAAIIVVIVCTVVGQAAVWAGMVALRKHADWDTGILFYLWAGAVFTCLILLYTWLFYLAFIPFIAPLFATVARSRHRTRPTQTSPTA